ncbi:MazG-like nucleotide pyrophosphohydrolase [Gordonia phage Mollymur]|uniref:MazG-like nucleotide pyrophosphohydrolase n=1 Tax=Gordonia phage Mollymur TaxID=2590895 RepID=A0A4Y6EBM3_9CAUD|nr:hydrolase [Gordonia phage Mollymur]QDF15472.1 MazG-like nucleotide pyrophosphohydrolase [Gordonia phage Mollymur]
MTIFTDVQQFHDAADVERPSSPTLTAQPNNSFASATMHVHLMLAASAAKDLALSNPDSVELHRIRLLTEELHETIKAILAGDMVGTADGLTDLVYVTAGSADEFGIDLDATHAIVHAANMAKANPETGKFDKDAGGRKIVKPEGWQPPEPALAELLGVAA